MPKLEGQFNFALSRIKSGSPGASEDCMDILREINSIPIYKVGEMQPVLNGKISNYCKATGESYESVAMKINLPKLK